MDRGQQFVRLTVAGIILVATGCVRAPAETFPAGPPLTAMVTWNMDAGRGDLPRLVADLDAGRLTPGLPLQIVLLLQEAVQEQSADLERLPGPRGWSVFFDPVRFDGRVTRGNAIVSSRPLLGAHAIALPRERQPRSAVAGWIEIEGRRIFVASAHLENRVSLWRSLFSDAARRRQAEALVAALPGGHGVLGGDFNTWLGRHEGAWRVLLKRFGDTPGVMRTATFHDRLVLDHLLFDLPDEWKVTTAVTRDRYGSNHHPVVAAISASGRAAGR